MTIWQQTEASPEDIFLPPLPVHHIPIQGNGSARIGQQRRERRHVGVWRQDNLSIVPAGEECRWRMLSPPNLVHIEMPVDLVRKVSQDVFNLDPDRVELRSVLCGQDPELGNLSRMLLRDLGDVPVHGRLYAESLANVFAVQLVAKFSNHAATLAPPRGGLPAHLFRRTVEHIDSGLGQSLSLAELAGQCGYSVWHFAKLFKAATGLAPHRFVTERRLLRAKMLLRDTALSISEIALDCGLVDQSHLNRLFRTHVGMSPARFRALSPT